MLALACIYFLRVWRTIEKYLCISRCFFPLETLLSNSNFDATWIMIEEGSPFCICHITLTLIWHVIHWIADLQALFRALKTKHATPKYGLIFHASLVGQAAPKIKGKISRSLAAKAALAIRYDALGDSQDNSLGLENRAKVLYIKNNLPVSSDPIYVYCSQILIQGSFPSGFNQFNSLKHVWGFLRVEN